MKLGDIMFDTWNRDSYKNFIDYLKSLQDLKYKEFHSSLVLNSKYEMIGIRLPIMRSISKKINNIEEFLKHVGCKYYEEVMIEGLVISRIKDEETFYKYFKKYIDKIDNWALCDSFCNSIKIVEKYEDKYFSKCINLSLSKDEFTSRVGLVTILSHFVNDKNKKDIFNLLNKIDSDKFYINMAEAWLVCELYIHYPSDTLEFIKNNNMNKFTQNKAISKIRDSYRVSLKEKELLSKYRK